MLGVIPKCFGNDFRKIVRMELGDKPVCPHILDHGFVENAT
jgi:hypothetical protein